MEPVLSKALSLLKRAVGEPVIESVFSFRHWQNLFLAKLKMLFVFITCF